MRLPITEQFLWTAYALYELTGEVLDIVRLPSSMPQVFRRIDGSTSMWQDIKRKKKQRQFAQFVYSLKKRGLIKITQNDQVQRGILLTAKGRQKALRGYFVSQHQKGLKRRSDRKFVMVIFDVPERLRKSRDILRHYLYLLGFKQLQKSVWVSPYDVAKEIERVIASFAIERCVRVFLIEELEA